MPPEFHTSPILQGIPGIRHGFFTRQGGVSDGLYASLNCSLNSGDTQKHVLDNRRRVVKALKGRCLVTNKQAHGRRVRVVDSQTDSEDVVEADGLVTSAAGVCIGVLGADCAPVLLCTPRVVGVAHVGWRGALLGITDAVIEAMEQIGAERSRIFAAVGPTIQSVSYEVGENLRYQYLNRSPVNAFDCFMWQPNSGKWHFDLPGYIVRRLRDAGIRQLDCSSLDTVSNESLFFSFRRACHRGESVYGRQISAICLD